MPAAYARWAGKRLPTEAEWERAAKGPNGYRYAYGNSFDSQKANSGAQKTSAVGSYPANEFGLCDMTGNVSEWTSSVYCPTRIPLQMEERIQKQPVRERCGEAITLPTPKDRGVWCDKRSFPTMARPF